MSEVAREEQWCVWMQAAVRGDAQAYHRFLTSVTPHLRVMARRRCAQFGAPASEAEDVVQEVLLSIHLKPQPGTRRGRSHHGYRPSSATS